MMRIAIRAVAALLIVIGFVFFLQGVNILPGSFMTGQTKWAICGGAMIVAGIGLLLVSRGPQRNR
jgi:hypothetical protein